MGQGKVELQNYPRCLKAVFSMSASSAAGMPNDAVPEIAIIGRSNVGKSSLLNRLTNQKKLARTSATPGRTQKLNVFDITLEIAAEKHKRLRIVDLPGYGFAKLSKPERSALRELIEDYLARRTSSYIACLLNDVRREPQLEEFSIRQLVWERGQHLIVVLTKLDKLSKTEQKKALAARSRDFELLPDDFVLSGEGISAVKFWERICLLVG